MTMTNQKVTNSSSDLEWEQQRELSTVSTFRIGGAARYFVVVRTVVQMQEVLARCYHENLPFFILGKGSNTLFDDSGFPGVVIHNKIEFCEWSDETTVRAGAGYSFALLGVQTARKGLSGLEFASGIPASVGGAVFMNAGANGRETCQSLVSVEYVDVGGERRVIAAKELPFRYRWSPFHEWKGAIVGATFRLTPSATARADQLAIIEYRTETQPYGEASAGCVFRNPPGGHAGALIEAAGLKGFAVGGAAVSETHANFIVNKGGATAGDVEKLIDTVRARVAAESGVVLEDEVRRIGIAEPEATTE